jgi:hypothetical protein
MPGNDSSLGTTALSAGIDSGIFRREQNSKIWLTVCVSSMER